MRLYSIRQSGFTLIELLAASVISAFIALIAVTSVKSVTSGRERIDQYTQTSEDLRFAIELIRQDLLNIYREATPDARVFYGGATPLGEEEIPYSTLRFHTVSLTPARMLQPEGDVYEVEYLVMGNEDQPDEPLKLVRRYQPNPYNTKNPGGMLSVLYSNIRSFDIVYFDPQLQEWVTAWPKSKNQLPGIVKVKLTGVTADGRHVLSRSAIIDFPRWPDQPENTGNSGNNKNNNNTPDNNTTNNNADNNTNNNNNNRNNNRNNSPEVRSNRRRGRR